MSEHENGDTRVDTLSSANSPVATTAGEAISVPASVSPDQRSPLPWYASNEPRFNDESVHVFAADPNAAGDPGDFLTVADFVSPANAAYIVRACNSYPALVSALKAMVYGSQCDQACAVCVQAREALKLAEATHGE